MKTDSERQTEYQKRRRQTEDRITVWVHREIEHGMDVLRGKDSRTTWMNRAVRDLTIRQLLGKSLSFTNDELTEATRRGLEMGIILPP